MRVGVCERVRRSVRGMSRSAGRVGAGMARTSRVVRRASRDARERVGCAATHAVARATARMAPFKEETGQGTTEYAILVGVLVLMAIVAVVAFRDNLQRLWTEITDGINKL